ncbi:MAG TPA: CADD family putative folate metabolism protein [Thermoanaerobaculia bacterium]|nr:CADD family putative folate metabolism protein [Thermoanaerobaculia bacterium]
MQIRIRLEEAVASRHLLDHSFYRRWSAGELSREELREYARQYWHFTLAFPTFVSAIHSGTDDLEARRLLLENLIEEERGAENHPELWLRFCEALGLTRDEVKGSEANAGTRALVETMRELTREGATHQGLASLFAYESQVPAVAAAKIEGLAKWYDMTAPSEIAFFTVHQEADVHHSATAMALLERFADDPASADQADHAARRTLDALYRFLDAVTIPSESAA